MAAIAPQTLIAKKRDGGELTPDEIAAFVNGAVDGAMSEGQIAAFAMAVFFNDMTTAERIALTRAMTDSGSVLDWAFLGGERPVIDKHSTGGVGDKVSFLLAPILAACGAANPMISGRGLGHTGGTLDKLESIPGYNVAVDAARLRRVVAEAGCAIVGQTDDLAPADRRIYAIRDVTATVESIAMIVASILSKKLAAGLDALVMDVKVGSGAFLPGMDQARNLARALVDVAAGAGLKTTALITDMNQVLGRTAGNALEIAESIAALRGEGVDERLLAVTRALCAEALVVGGLCAGTAAAELAVDAALADGRAAERFAVMVAGLGGPADLLERPWAYLATAPLVRPAGAERGGWVTAVDVRAVGQAIVALGGGRTRPGAAVDHAVGMSDVAAPGAKLAAGDALATIHARAEDDWRAAQAALRRAITVSDDPPPASRAGADIVKSRER